MQRDFHFVGDNYYFNIHSSRFLNHLGTGPYLSPEGGGAKDFRGDHLIFMRTKEGLVVIENPKRGGGVTENFEKIQRGTTQICLENEDKGGSRKSSNVIRGITSVK